MSNKMTSTRTETGTKETREMKTKARTTEQGTQPHKPAQPATTTSTAATASTDTAPPAVAIPPRRFPESQRPDLTGWIYAPETNGQLAGVIRGITARYCPEFRAVRAHFTLAGHQSCTLLLEHDQIRAALLTLEHSLAEFTGQCRFWPHPCADFNDLGAPMTGSASPERIPLDQEFRFHFVPHRDLICATATFSSDQHGGSIRAYLTRPQAEALLYDLGRGLANLELVEGDLL